MTDEACRIYHYLKATGLTLTVGEASHMFRITSDQAKRAFSELKRTRHIERKADRYCGGFMAGSYGAKPMILERKIYDYIERNPNKRTSEIVFQMNTDYTDFDIVLDALRRLVKEGRVFGEVGHTVRGTGAFVTWTKV